jgi:ABC-type lipoprotein export system ATPase subunit
MSNVIEIVVSGEIGSGKTHVLALIDKALRVAYGQHVQIASYDLSTESSMGFVDYKPKVASTIFSLKERALPANQVTANLKVEVDTAEVDAAIARVEAIQGCASSFALDPLESAISEAVNLLNGQAVFLAECNLNQVQRAGLTFLNEKLNSHLNHLLAAQLRRVEQVQVVAE